MSIFLKWAAFRCCMWFINIHAKNFRGAWQWMQFLLLLGSIAGFAFAIAFLGRLAWHSEWAELAIAIVIAVIILPIMTAITRPMGENVLFLSLPALIAAPCLALLLW